MQEKAYSQHQFPSVCFVTCTREGFPLSFCPVTLTLQQLKIYLFEIHPSLGGTCRTKMFGSVCNIDIDLVVFFFVFLLPVPFSFVYTFVLFLRLGFPYDLRFQSASFILE